MSDMRRQLPPTITAGKSPDWLPAGWIMESRVLRTGREIRSYKHLKTSKKFFTKDDVLQHIAMEKVRDRRLQNTYKHLQMCTEIESMRLVAEPEPDGNLEWLPDNWIVEVRTRKNGFGVGMHEKIYIDLSTGIRCYSRPEVLQYLGSAEYESILTREEERSTSSDSQVVVQTNDRPEWLPDDWTMEVRTHKSGANKGREFKIYTDHLTGCKFYSKPQVLRYLGYSDYETSTEEHEKISTSGNSSSKTLSPAKRQKTENLATRRQLFAGEDNDPLAETDDSPAPQNEEVSSEGNLVNVAVGIAVQAKEISSLSSSKELLKAENNQGYKLVSVLSEKKSNESDIEKISDESTNNRDSNNVPCDASDNIFTFCDKSKEPFQEYQALCKEQQAVVNKMSGPSILLSFGDHPSLDPCLELACKTLTGTVPVENLTNDDGLVSKRQSKSRRRNNSSRKLKKKELKLHQESSEQFVEPEMVPSILLGERIAKSCSNKSEHGICFTSNGSETGVAHQNPFDIRNSPLVGSSRKTKLPMERRRAYLSDMRLEFSFKSLIGETTMDDDSVISNYLKQHYDARGTGEGKFPIPDFGLPNFSQIKISPGETDERLATNPSLPSCSITPS